MKHNLLKSGKRKLIKSVIKFIFLLSLFNSHTVFSERVLYIGSMQSHGHTATRKVLLSAYQKLNITVQFVYLPAERALISSNKGVIDGEDSRIAGLEKTYHNLIPINIPIEKVNLFAYSKNKSIIIKDWYSLKPYRIAYLRGVKVIEKNLIGFNSQTVTDIKQAFMMLEHNRVDIVISDEFQAEHITDSSINKLIPPIYSFPVFHYLNKKNRDLVPKLEAVLIQMQKNGTIDRVLNETK